MSKNHFIITALVTVNVCMLIANINLYKRQFYNKNYQTIYINETIEKININECTFEALESLGGIGTHKANKIFFNRPYDDIHEIRKVVGDKVFYNIKDKITVK